MKACAFPMCRLFLLQASRKANYFQGTGYMMRWSQANKYLLNKLLKMSVLLSLNFWYIIAVFFYQLAGLNF